MVMGNVGGGQGGCGGWRVGQPDLPPAPSHSQEDYERAKASDPHFFAGKDSLQARSSATAEANIDRMVAELDAQNKKRRGGWIGMGAIGCSFSAEALGMDLGHRVGPTGHTQQAAPSSIMPWQFCFFSTDD